MQRHAFVLFLSAACGLGLAATAARATAQDAPPTSSTPTHADTAASTPAPAASTASPAALTSATQPPMAGTGAVQPLGPDLEEVTYPYPVQRYRFKSQRQAVQMAYMDVQPTSPNGQVALLLHGKNFCSNYWHGTIKALTKAGYRVIAPDQIGFCKSSKPAGYQYSFQQLAANTHDLLSSLKIGAVTVIGHSMGGMLAMRYALMYPRGVDKLVLVDPMGLEDWQAKGVPWRSIDDWYAKTRKTNLASIRAYQKKFYYNGTWTPAYARWARLQAGMYKGPGRDKVAWAAAKTYAMIYTEPVVHELENIRVPTTLIIGQNDHTSLGHDMAPPTVAARLGNYRKLEVEAASTIPDATLIKLPNLGHAPQIQDPQRFDAALDQALGIQAGTTPNSASSSGTPPGAGSSAPSAPGSTPAPAASAAPATSIPAPASAQSGSGINGVMDSNSTDRGMTHDGPAAASTSPLPSSAPVTTGSGGPR